MLQLQVHIQLLLFLGEQAPRKPTHPLSCSKPPYCKVSIQEIQNSGSHPCDVPIASLHLPVGLQGQFSTVCDFSLHKTSTYSMQSLMTTGRGWQSNLSMAGASLRMSSTEPGWPGGGGGAWMDPTKARPQQMQKVWERRLWVCGASKGRITSHHTEPF